ncbi:L,D-transpeptidase family protein [Streptomyces sp. NPDC007808]|uniref:L,D-transpeptidase family protein n=1 Tax=Streptomyces sp. NPDC007808 TaxID=3364779 RepID=UPI003674020D
MISGRIACRSIAVVLVAASLLPVGSASADPVPPVSGAEADRVSPAPGAEAGSAPSVSGAEADRVTPAPGTETDPVPPASGPESDLVPGVPLNVLQLWQTDTPDQALPPRVYKPSPEEDAVEPRDAPDEAYDLVEYVPPMDALENVKCSEETGPHQRQVEKYLKLKVDGEQSAADCRAVRAFQKKHRIKPAMGFAGPVTWATMQLVAARKNPNAAKKCPVRAQRVACVDLDRQLAWVQNGRRVVFGPVHIRSGRAGYGTRAGWHRIYWRHKNHVSSLYNSPMPYSQFFNGGQAFHGVYGSLFTPVGSMGCVNLRLDDARALWRVLKKNDRVYVWGHRTEE